MKNYLVAVLLIFSLLPLSGCGDAGVPTRPNTFSPLTSIAITATKAQIANLTSTQFTALGNFSGLFTRDISANVLWSSADPAVATVSNATGMKGRVTGTAPGTTTISATLDGIGAASSLTVTGATISTIALTPLAPTIAKGLTSQFQAQGSFSDATTQDISHDVSWSSSDPVTASISDSANSKGLARALAGGSTTITATFGGVSANTLLTVSAASLNAITLSPDTPSILSLSRGQLTATGTFSDATTLDITHLASWTSSSPSIATIDNTTGQVTTLIAGLTTISASLDGISASTHLTVSGGNLAAITVLPENSAQIHLSPSLPLEMSAEGVFPNASRDISTEVTWSSTNSGVATIDTRGVVTTVATGVTTIEAVHGTLSGSTTLTLTTATFNPGTLIITPASSATPTIASSTSQQFTASGNFSDGSLRDLTSAVSWSTTAPTIANVSDTAPSKGVATGMAAGSATISADFRGQDSDSTDLLVTAPTLQSVIISPLAPSVLPGEGLQFAATATYNDNPLTLDVTRDVSWSSANPSIAMFPDNLKNPGKVLGVNTGSVEITVSFGGMTDSVTLVVQ